MSNDMIQTWKTAQEWLIDDSDKHLMSGYKWFVNSNGYLVRNLKMRNGKCEKADMYLHRLVTGAKKGDIVDHINGNKLDNRRSNLRIVDKGQNNLNRRVENVFGCAGIRKVGEKFRAYISENNKQKHLGYFDSLEDAIVARKEEYAKRFN